MKIMRTIRGEVEFMTIKPEHSKIYFKAGWSKVEDFQEFEEVAPVTTSEPKKIGRPKKHNG